MIRVVIALGTAAVLAGCSPAQPRAVSYFKAHPNEAGKVVADCQAGTHRGAECDNAREAEGQLRSDARMADYKKSF